LATISPMKLPSAWPLNCCNAATSTRRRRRSRPP
jgi:hypothetical protein